MDQKKIFVLSDNSSYAEFTVINKFAQFAKIGSYISLSLSKPTMRMSQDDRLILDTRVYDSA